MTVTLPAQFGKADWTDYVDFWRDADVTWIQDRIVTRYADAAARDAAIPTPANGMLVYNEADDWLNLRSKTGKWLLAKYFPQNLTTTKDDATSVNFSHVSAGGKGVIISPTAISYDLPVTVAGALTADNITVKTGGGVAAKLTTDGTNLLVDKPLSVSAIKLTGTGATMDAPGQTLNVGTLKATLVEATNISLSGTLTGGVLNGTGGTIGGVKIGLTQRDTTPTNNDTVDAPHGFISQGAIFYGGSTSGVIRTRAANGDLGATFIQFADPWVIIDGENHGGTLYLRNTIRIENPVAPVRNMLWQGPGADGYLAVVVYSASDPGAANFPAGTIWIS